ncbi:MAG: hypothetical protein GXP41_06810 [Chloroflexi bacterium]|nr:hypothetical protein [Chloroflexota bacterium]
MLYLRADVNTEFQIDWSKIERPDLNRTQVMEEYLCASCREELEKHPDSQEMVDGVDMVTGEVHRVSLVHEHLVICCSAQPDYITPTTPLSTALFRALLATWNHRLTPLELQKQLGVRRSNPEAILRLLTRGPVRESIIPVPTA